MRVLLKLVLDCTPEAAWRAIQSPTVFREVSGPFLDFSSLETAGFPPRWDRGEHPVTVRAAGMIPVGEHRIDIDFPDRRLEGARILRDTGRGVSGLTSLITEWDHRMAIAADPAGTGKTLYRDQLKFSAGPLTATVWPGLWALWQWRGARLAQLAPTWSSTIGEPHPSA